MTGIDATTVVALALVVGACRPADRPPPRAIMPGPTQTAIDPARVGLNADCARCHPQQAAEWSASQHRTAHSDPDYQRVVAHERQGFCQSCHAPESGAGVAPTPAAAALGVACVTCHLPPGSAAILAAPGPPSPEAHAVQRSAAFSGVDACTGCHEFSFPQNPSVAMQATVTEHAGSPFADMPCAECHLPWVGEGELRHRDHGFAASRDRTMLRSAVVVTAERQDGGRVTLSLSPGRIGHAFPTGDLFRRLWVDVEAVDHEGDGVAYDGRALGRRFAPSGGRMLGDDRPGAPAQRDRDGRVEVAFDLGETVGAHPIRWRVLHQRVELPLHGDDAELFGQTLVESGELPPRETKP